MRTILLLGLFLAAAMARGAETNVPANAAVLPDRAAVLKSAQTVTLQKYPNADEVLVDDFTHVAYRPDGTDDEIEDTYVKVLTEKGRQDEQTLSFGFDAAYSTMAVVRAEVIRPDSTSERVNIARQSQVMTDRSMMGDNIYDPNQKVLAVNVPDLNVGDIVHYVVTQHAFKTIMPDAWDDFQTFEDTCPIVHSVYEVVSPKALPLQHAVIKDAIAGTVTATVRTAGGATVHRWEVRDVPRFFEEPNMPQAYSVVQRLLLSTTPDWQTVSRWYWKVSAPHLRATSPALIAKVKELTAGAKTGEEKIEKLFTFVSQQVRYMGITTETNAPGYEPHDVRITFGDRFGVCRDKAALLVAMLREAGFPAFPVLINVGPKKDAEVPLPWFNHAIVGLKKAGGGYQLLDATAENTSDMMPAYLCNRSYLVATPEGDPLRTSPVIPASSNLLRIASTGRISKDGTLTLHSTLAFDGINDTEYRGYFARISPDERRRDLDADISSLLPGATLTDFQIEPADLRDTTKPLKIVLSCKAPGWFIAGGGERMLPMPWLGGGFGLVNHILGQTGLDKRRFPLKSQFACGVTETISLDLAGDEKPLAVPKAEEIDHDDLEFRQDCSVASNRVSATGSFMLKAVEYPPDRYAALKQSLRDMEYARRQKVIFPDAASASAARADAEILDRDIHIDVKDGHTWTVTHHEQLKILSYSGKKRLSELHLDYNPAWETVAVTNVTVVTPGRPVQRLVPQEINVMDAAWAGSAPRYPAAKTFVVSLPGVSVGSVITYTIIRTYRDQPFFSAAMQFSEFNPVDHETLAVTAPVSLALKIWKHDAPAETRSEAGGRVTWTWTAKNQPALVREDAMPPLWSFTPAVLLSSGDWETYAKAVIGPMEKLAKVTPEIKKAVREATRGAKAGYAQATAIRDYVAINVRLAGPPPDELPAGIVTPPAQTLAEGYGNTRDRALLYYVMLKQAGFDPEFVLASSGCPLVPELSGEWLATPQRDTFDTVLVRVRALGDTSEFAYFNDTDQYARLGCTPDALHALLTASGVRRIISVPEASEETTRLSETIRIATNGEAVITRNSEFYGMTAAGFYREMAQQTPEERRRYAQETVAGISQSAKLEGGFKVDAADYPATVSYTVRVPRFAVRDGDQMYFTLPGRDFSLPGEPADRANPLYADDHDTVTRKITLELPRGAVLVKPESEDESTPGGLARIETAFTGATTLYGSEFIATRPALIPPRDYGELHRINTRLRRPAARTFLLKLAE